ncbi:putative CRAL/TRIO domain containing protein [Leishmania utingensis]|uniref:CRAL/TRIO domain containing protein n=1 Tax=Leishmania utingensis TaxID=653362 RepID=A0AAW3A2I2_9TRYP
MEAFAEDGSAAGFRPQSGTCKLTREQVEKIEALIHLMKEHYDPLPAQLEMYLQLIPPPASVASAEEDSGNKAQPRHLVRNLMRSYCSSFLVSREWDVQKAFSMMQDVVAYRAANRLDEQCFFPPAISVHGWSTVEVCRALRQSPRETALRVDRVCAGVTQGITCGIHYWDKGGRPVAYVMIESLDVVELMRQLRQMASVGKSPADVMWEYMVHLLGVTESVMLYQLIQREARRSGRSSTSKFTDEATPAEVTQGAVTMIYDMKGLSVKMLWKPILDLFRDLAKEFFKYYPDRVHQIICVNSPSLVRYAFRLVRGVMPADFQNKISFFSSHDTLATLEKVIDKKYIPHFLGGDCHCTAEGGECLSGYDPLHPRRAAVTDAHADGNGEVCTEDVTLTASQACTRVFPVKASEVVVWDFAVAGGGHDIIFTVFFVPQSAASGMRWSEVEVKKLSPYTVTSEALPEGSDLFVAAEDGVVVLGWRNRRSWFAAKRIQLRAYNEAMSTTLHE